MADKDGMTKKKVCKCPACPDGTVYLLTWSPLRHEWECDNPDCQTNRIGAVKAKHASNGGELCGAYAECREELGRPEGWKGCSLPKGHEGDHSDVEAQCG